MDKQNNSLNLKQLYSISFIEGGVVMVTELAGAKLLTPFFGATLYSWAGTLSVTLLALMSGYYYGGYITTKPKFSSPKKITQVFFASGLAVLLMPSLGHFIMQRTINFSFFTGLIVSQLIFLFLPIFLMGIISPMIIFQITNKAEYAGRSAGNIYAISTSGGILFTLIFGFLIIPNYGISTPVRLLGLFVAALALFFLFKDKVNGKKIPLLFLFTCALAFITFSRNKSEKFSKGDIRILEVSEGLMGELKVIDQISYPPNLPPMKLRSLRINNVTQNQVFADMPTQSTLYYVNFTRQLMPFFSEKKSALLIGLGAGSIYKILSEQYNDVETVEIDQRIYDMGMKYFGMTPHKNHHITDGRYFINITQKKYDLIMLDAIIGENIPAQLITQESFQRIYDLLNENGTLIIENGGLADFSNNSLIPSIYKTLQSVGFKVVLFNPLRSDNYGDVVFVATKKEFEIKNRSIMADVMIKGGALSDYELSLALFDNNSANIFTDDINNCDVMLRSHYFSIRKVTRAELVKAKFWE